MKKIAVLPYTYKGQEIQNLYLLENFETKNYQVQEYVGGDGFTNSFDFVKNVFGFEENDLERLDYLDTVKEIEQTYECYCVDVDGYSVNNLINMGYVEVPVYMIHRITDCKVLAMFLKTFLHIAQSRQSKETK